MLLARITGTLKPVINSELRRVPSVVGGRSGGPIECYAEQLGRLSRQIISYSLKRGQSSRIRLTYGRVIVDGDLHIFAGDNYATWVAHIENNPAVRLQSEAGLYAFKAQRVTDEAHFKLFSQAWEEKIRRPAQK